VHGQFVDACCGQAPRTVAVNVVTLTEPSESSESSEAGGVSRRNSGRGRSRISRSRFSIKTARQYGSHCSVKQLTAHASAVSAPSRGGRARVWPFGQDPSPGTHRRRQAFRSRASSGQGVVGRHDLRQKRCGSLQPTGTRCTSLGTRRGWPLRQGRRRQCEGDLPARTGTDRQCCSHGRVTSGIRVRPRDRHDGTTMDRSTKSDERSS